jgi:hypothetical protein
LQFFKGLFRTVTPAAPAGTLVVVGHLVDSLVWQTVVCQHFWRYFICIYGTGIVLAECFAVFSRPDGGVASADARFRSGARKRTKTPTTI